MAIGPPKRKVMTRSFASYFVAYMDNDLTTYAAAISYFSMLVLFPTLLLLLTVGNRLIGPDAVEKYVIGQVLAFLPGAQGFVRKNLESITAISSGAHRELPAHYALGCVLVVHRDRKRPEPHLWHLSAILSAWPARQLRSDDAGVRLPGRLGAGDGGSFWNEGGSREHSARLWSHRRDPVRVSLADNLHRGERSHNDLSVRRDLQDTAEHRRSIERSIAGRHCCGVLWEGAKFGFAALLPYFHYDLVYGSIGAGVALLSWVYLSSVIMLFGAQFTALLHRDHLFESSAKKTNSSNDLSAAES